MCPSKNGITFNLHLFITIRAQTLDNRHQCDLILPIIHQYGRHTAHQQYVRILCMFRQSQYVHCAYYHPSQYGRIIQPAKGFMTELLTPPLRWLAWPGLAPNNSYHLIFLIFAPVDNKIMLHIFCNFQEILPFRIYSRDPCKMHGWE